MRIERVYASQIGVFDAIDIIFPLKEDSQKAELHIFTGSNGSGKSTLLYILASFFGSQYEAYRRYRNNDSFCEGIIEGEFVRVQLKERADDSTFHFDTNTLLSSSKSAVTASTVDVHYAYRSGLNDRINQYVLNRANSKIQGTTFDFVVFTYSGNRNVQSIKIDGIRELTGNPFEGSLSFQNSTNTQLIVQWIANTITKVALAKAKNNMQRAEKLERNIKKITEVIAQISGYEIEFELEDTPLNVVLKMGGKSIEFDVLPDGLKSIISWVADLLMRMDRIEWVDDRNIFEREFILLLDEVDIHLHPSWQRKILPVIQNLFVNAQIFVSTHSPFVVASVDSATIYKLEVNDGVSKLAGIEKAKAGFSYGYVLEEVFGVGETFDVGTEKLFDEFYLLKETILGGDVFNQDRFTELSSVLASKSIETKDIVARELRQLARLSGREFTI